MGRERRTRILVDGDPALSRSICEQIEERHTVRLISAPREVLVMNKVRESAGGSLFYLGEALLTECRVALGEVTGFGLLLGSHHRRAFELAVIDAAFGQPEPLPEQAGWVSLLIQEEGRMAAREAQLHQRLDATRVEFAEMSAEEELS
jgi:alpha-D-ribose 1-methylphosphonate 5-triphosphate synthase subunit PhnG